MSFETMELVNIERDEMVQPEDAGPDRSNSRESKQERLFTPEELAKMNYYERLGVSENATAGEIQENFRELSTRYHPDKKGGNDFAFRYISEAYTALKDPEKRKEYDKQLKKEREKARTRTSSASGGAGNR